jgi:hypothetical protein
MEGNGRRLAWIAIALSAVALVVSLGGRMGPRGHDYYAAQAPGAPAVPAAPAAPVAPQGEFGPRGEFGPQGKFGPHWKGEFDQRFRQEFRGPGAFRGDRHFGPGMFFFWPFMLLGKLIKLAFVVLLIWLGLKLIRGRGNGGRWGRGGGEPPSRPGPEQPPYTGDTTQI